MASQRPPLPPPPSPLHRITVVLRTLRHSQWLNHIHRHHTHPRCRQHIRRLFWHIDRLLVYIRRHGLLPATSSVPQARGDGCRLQEEDVAHIRWQDVELRRMHQQQLQESLTRIRHYIRPLHQFLLCHQPGQLTSYHQCMNILHIFTSQL